MPPGYYLSDPALDITKSTNGLKMASRPIKTTVLHICNLLSWHFCVVYCLVKVRQMDCNLRTVILLYLTFLGWFYFLSNLTDTGNLQNQGIFCHT